MATRNVIIPSSKVPMVDAQGLVDPVWLRFLSDLHERTGGGADDKVETGAGAASDATAALAAAAAAQSTADGAVVDAAAAQSTADTVTTDFDRLDDPAFSVALDGNIGFYGTTPISIPTVTGATGGNVALQNLLTQLDALGLIIDSTT